MPTVSPSQVPTESAVPLRKQGTIIRSAVCAGLIGFAAIPASANAGILDSLLKPKASTTTTTTVKATTPSGNTSTSIVTTTNTPAPSAVTSSAVPAGAACTPLPTTKAFQNVDGDAADYSPAPNGTFENGTGGWTLTGGAKVANANETLGISPGTKALQMPLMSTATSPNFCVDESNPHFRFAFKVDNAVLSGFIAYVIYRDAAGKITNIELVSSKLLALSPSTWQATPNNPLATLIPLNATAKTASVQLKLNCLSPTDLVNDVTGGVVAPITNFVGVAGGLVGSVTGLLGNQTNIGITVDSVMVDPYRRG